MDNRDKNRSQLRWYDHILLHLISPLAALLIKALMLTCRVIKVEGEEKAADIIRKTGGGAVYATWHQRMSYHFHYFGSRRVTIMISQSRDGEYAATIAKWVGFKNVRGSSTRGGSQALKEMINRVRNGAIGGMLADGPQGPPRVAKTGSVVLARDASVPLIPVVWGADRCWTFNSWDRYIVPKPLSRVVIFYAEPLIIPLDTKDKDLKEFRRIFESRLNRATSWCDEQFGFERPWRKASGKGISETGPLDFHDDK